MLNVQGTHLDSSLQRFLSTISDLTQKLKPASEPNSSEISQKNPSELLTISNKATKYRLAHGQEFAALLQPRDKVLEHEFNIELELDHLMLQQESLDFTGSSQYTTELKGKIKKFLVQVVSNVVSVAFNNLNLGHLQEKQSMEYAAKNILLNIQAIYKRTVQAIEGHQLLKKRVVAKQLRADLIASIEQILDNVLVNLSDHYPQAPASGGTPRMREVINEVNHVDNEENDLIFANNLLISNHLKLTMGLSREENQLAQKIQFETDDYTPFIMEVINTAIQASQKNQEDSRERTIKEIFSEFNEKLFCISQQKQYHHIISSLDDKLFEMAPEDQVSSPDSKYKENTKAKICRYFDLTLERNHRQLAKYNDSKEEKDLIEETQAGLEELRREKKHLIGQKIPPFVRVFTRQDIANKKFTAGHSSILRILTKWAMYLQDIFKNAQSYIKQRLYPFKTIKNELVFIKEEAEKQRLIAQLKQEYREVKIRFNEIFKNNSTFISQFLLADPEQFASYVNRYSETRVVSSKINAVLTNLMLKYASSLIYHLLRAGREVITNKREQNINLVVFRVSDLLRAKFQCNESSFINLLKTMYLLDSTQSLRKKFKLVRVKNKLDQPANNIMVNFMFMGRVQCELQLSIQEPKGKQKHYYAFSHFVYELTRGRFGPIAECAIMTSQLDPMIAACKNIYYVEKQRKRQPLQVEKSLQQMEQCRTVRSEDDSIQDDIEGQVIRETPYEPEQMGQMERRQQIFQCVNCKKLIINESHELFTHKGNQFLCNRCIIDHKEAEQQLSDPELRQAIIEGLQYKFLQRIPNLGALKKADNLCILSISGNGTLNLNVVIQIAKQLKVFLVKLDSKLLKQIESKKFDFSSIDYFNVTNNFGDSKKDKPAFELLYSIPDGPCSLSGRIYDLMKVKKELIENKLKIVINTFKGLREEKNIIKTIKFKSEILSIHQDNSKFRTFGKIVDKLVLKPYNNDKQMEEFKYKRYRHLDFSNLKQLQLIGINIEQMPVWLHKCINFQKIVIEGTQITKVQPDEVPLNTSQLCLRENKLQHVQLSRLGRLMRLDLDSNRLPQIDLSALQNVGRLSLNHNRLCEIDVSMLHNLTSLSITNNQLKDIKLPTQSRLKELNLNFNKLQRIDLTGLNHLIKLNLNNNKIVEINLSSLNNLTILNMQSNCLTSVDLSNLVNLSTVVLNKNQLTQVNLSNLTSLVSLCLDQNQLSSLDLGDLTSLSRLDLGTNRFTSIDLSSLVCLTQLGLDSNELTTLDLSSLSCLTNLDLQNNQIQRLDLSTLGSLTQLYLSYNHLVNLDLSTLNNLLILNINDNPFNRVDLPSLPSLKQLHINRKQIIDFNFSQLPCLEKLFVYNGFISEEQLINFSFNTILEVVEPET